MGNNQIVKRDAQLPATLEELSKFVLVGREKLVSVRAEIRAIDKLNLAEEVKEQKKEEATNLAEALLDAETKIGELLVATEPVSYRDDSGKITKWDNKLPDGISRNQSSAFQKMADNKDIVELVKAEAKSKDTLPTRATVIRKINNKTKKEAQEEAKAAMEEVPLPERKYSTIVIDPPWPVEKILRDERPNQVEFDYPTMTIDEITAFKDKIDAIADEDCHLFMWTTEKYLPKSFDIIKAWGFRYILTMVWHKSGGFQPQNLPQYNCEFVIYARKGSPEFTTTKDFFCCFDGKRREHSRKPDEFYNIIQRVTPSPRIDIFSREKHDGFDQYGNETGKF